MNLVSCRKRQSDVIHARLYLFAQFQLISCLSSDNRQINRIQPIDPVITLRLLFHTDDLHQFVQADDSPILHFHLYLPGVKLPVIMFGHQHQPNPLLARSRLFHIISPQKLFLIMQTDCLTNFIRTHPQRTQLLIIILQTPFHRCGSADVYLIDSRKLRKACLYMFLRILLNQTGSGRRINRECDKRSLTFLLRTCHLNVRVTNSRRQFRPSLTNDGRSLKTCDSRICMLVQTHIYTSPAIAGSRRYALYSLDTGKHRLQFAGSRHLHDTRRSPSHAEPHRKSG